MSQRPRLGPDLSTIAVTVPLRIGKRGGRKHVVSPDGAPAWMPWGLPVDGTLVKALARAFRWRRLLDEGAYATTEELAAAEKINPSYLSRVLRLTLLAPDIVEAILDGRQSPSLDLPRLLRRFPRDWPEQRQVFQPSA